jgi:HPt (histidine-containing phosphotransfer) domain-containing protein
MTTRLRVWNLPAALARLGNNISLAREMFAMLSEDAPVYQSRLKSAVAKGDAADVLHAAHALKGLLLIFGAEAALQFARRLEQVGRAGDLAEARTLIGLLDSEINRFLKTASSRLAKL